MARPRQETVELVQLARLEAQVSDDMQQTTHEYDIVNKGGHQTGCRGRSVWQTRKRLGAGGFGEVFEEECVEGEVIGAMRAVKRMLISASARQGGGMKYQRELDAVAKFSQPKYREWFVESYGWYDTADTVIIAMEFVQLGDLDNHMRSPFPEAEVQLIVCQVVDGLVHMHGQGYAHRDLKPANLLVFREGPQWQVKIADFGLSKQLKSHASAPSTGAGTFGYMAPETAGFADDDSSPGEQQREALRTAVDIWSLGVIAFQLLTFLLPFPDLNGLGKYFRGSRTLPVHHLDAKRVSSEAQMSIRSFLAPNASDRPNAAKARRADWLISPPQPSTTNVPSSSESQASAQWSVEDSARLDDSGYQTSTRSTTQVSRTKLLHRKPLPPLPIAVTATLSLSDSASSTSPRQGEQPILDEKFTRGPEQDTSFLSHRRRQGSDSQPQADGISQRSDTEHGLVRTRMGCVISSLAFSPDGMLLAAVCHEPKPTYKSQIRLLDTTTGAEVKRIDAGDGCSSPHKVAFSADGSLLILPGLRDNNGGSLPSLFEVTTGKGLTWAALVKCKQVVMSPDSKLVSFHCRDILRFRYLNLVPKEILDHVHIHDAVTGERLQTLGPLQPRQAPTVEAQYGLRVDAFSSAAHVFATAHDGVQLFDTVSWAALGSLDAIRGQNIQAMAFSPSGDLFACTIITKLARRYEIHIFETAGLRSLKQFEVMDQGEVESGRNQALAFSADGTLLTWLPGYIMNAYVSGRRWQTDTWSEVALPEAEYLACSPSGELVAGFALRQSSKDVLLMKVWDINTGVVVGRHSQQWNNNRFWGARKLQDCRFHAAFSQDGRLITFSYRDTDQHVHHVVQILEWKAFRAVQTVI
ncbi:hypothetical protein LTR95_001598 [Oleoguttula sp. CCFEE 5521]